MAPGVTPLHASTRCAVETARGLSASCNDPRSACAWHDACSVVTEARVTRKGSRSARRLRGVAARATGTGSRHRRSTLAMTLRYAQLSPGHQLDAVQRLNRPERAPAG